jgi:hypothetical protein
MPPVGFEPMISVLKRAKTVHALDRTATMIGKRMFIPVFEINILVPTCILFFWYITPLYSVKLLEQSEIMVKHCTNRVQGTVVAS